MRCRSGADERTGEAVGSSSSARGAALRGGLIRHCACRLARTKCQTIRFLDGVPKSAWARSAQDSGIGIPYMIASRTFSSDVRAVTHSCRFMSAGYARASRDIYGGDSEESWACRGEVSGTCGAVAARLLLQHRGRCRMDEHHWLHSRDSDAGDGGAETRSADGQRALICGLIRRRMKVMDCGTLPADASEESARAIERFLDRGDETCRDDCDAADGALASLRTAGSPPSDGHVERRWPEPGCHSHLQSHDHESGGTNCLCSGSCGPPSRGGCLARNSDFRLERSVKRRCSGGLTA